jgi:integrase
LYLQVKEKGHGRTAWILRATLAAAYNCARRSPFDAGLPSEFISFQISTNPVEPIPAIAVNAGQRVLTEDELKTFITALGDTPLDLVIKVALFSGGQRMAQLLRAEAIHWDVQNRTLLLYDGKGKRRNPREHLLPLQGMAAGIIDGIMEKHPAKWIFSNNGGKTRIHEANTGKRISDIIADKKMTDFNYRDIRRTCATMMASLGVNKDTRAQLLSHGISGVQVVHYDRHDYLNEKRAALAKWEHHLIEIISGVVTHQECIFWECRIAKYLQRGHPYSTPHLVVKYS